MSGSIRQTTHGDYEDGANFTQSVKELMRSTDNWFLMESHQKESLDMVVHKMARILYGNHDFVDHWRDGSSYLNLSKQLVSSKIGAKDVRTISMIRTLKGWNDEE